MAAFRFLALLTVGFSLLVLIFLLHVHQARLEREMTREIVGPSLELHPGEDATWIVDLGGARVEEAWPGEQRQPHIFLRGPAVASGSVVRVRARYLDALSVEGGEAPPPALESAFVSRTGDDGFVTAEAGEADGELALGPVWLSWDHPLELSARIEGATPTRGAFVLRGSPSTDSLAARSIARTLWAVFTVMSAAGFAGLILTVAGRRR